MACCLYWILGSIFWIYRTIADHLSDYIFGLYYGKDYGRIPPLTNTILLESATNLARKIREGQISSEEIVQAYIERIKDINHLINALVDNRFESAIEEAKSADNLVRFGGFSIDEIAQKYPLLGVPFTTKECMQVQGLKNSCGLVSRKNVISSSSAPVVKQLMDRGAILLGVCNVSELMAWPEAHNHVYGRTNNCYDLSRTCGGSTGGDGSLVAACGSLIALGTDIGGSVRIPSFCNGIFGHKPTAASVDLNGTFPGTDGELLIYNTFGCLCRHAEDLIPMLKCMLKSDLIAEQMKLDETVALSQLKIFYQEAGCGGSFASPIDPEIRAAILQATSHFEKVYGIKVTKLNIGEFEYACQMYGTKIKNGAKGVTMSALMANLSGEVNGYTELLKHVIGRSDHTCATIITAIYEKLLNTDPDYIHKIDMKFSTLKNRLNFLLSDNGVLFFPTSPKPALYHNQALALPLNFIYTAIFNVLGFPSTHCPMGLNSDGIPIGFQVVAGAYNDRLTLAVAVELEKVFGGWVPPCKITAK